MKKVKCSSGMRGLIKDKSIQDSPSSGYRKIISGKLETHYERQCLGSFLNTTKLDTKPYSKEGLIITKSVSEKMDSILKAM